MNRLFIGLAACAAIVVSAMLAAPLTAQAPSTAKKQVTERLNGPATIDRQPAQTWLAVNFIGAPVQNPAGEALGNINNLLVHENGTVEAALIGVGGVLGIGEKTIAVPFDTLTIKEGKDGMRVFVLDVSLQDLEKTNAFVQTEPSTSDQARAMLERAGKTLQSAVQSMQKSAEEMSGKAKKSLDSLGSGETTQQ